MLPVSPPQPDEDVQSLLARAAASHTRELEVLSRENAALKAKLLEAYTNGPQRCGIERCRLPTPRFDDSGVNLPPPSADDCGGMTLCSKNPLASEASWDARGETEILQSKVALGSMTLVSDEWFALTQGLHNALVVDRWQNLVDGLIDEFVSKEDVITRLHAVRAWRRWVLLSDHLVRFYMEGCAPPAITGFHVKLDILSVWLWRTQKMIVHFPDSFSIDCIEGIQRKYTSFVGDTLSHHNKILRRCTIHPHSIGLMCWILLGGIAVLYDVFMIPLDVSGLAAAPGSITAASCVFWIADFLICCRTGVETKDCIVDMRFGTILRAYGSSWLIPDLLVILIDIFLFGMESGEYGALRANKIVRFMRLMRLLRLRKMGEAWRSLENSIYVAYAIMVGKCLKYMLVIFTLNHYVACVWYGIAAWAQNTGVRTWLDGLEHMVSGKSDSYVYSLHWSLTQISPATQNISAQNTFERTFALFVSLLALFAFSMFVSQLTNALNQLLRCKNEQDRQELVLREFFRSRGTSTILGSQIMSFFRQSLHSNKRMTEAEVSFFAEVPETMMVLLHEEMYLDVLLVNQFFYEFHGPETHGTFLKLCHTAMRELSVHPRQDVFIPGSNAIFVCAVTNGSMVYKHRHAEFDISAGSWLSEMGLWIQWQHAGTLTASTSRRCDLSAINLSAFQSVFASGGESLYEPFRCMAIFTVEQVEMAASKGIWPTDLPISEQLKESVCRRVQSFMDMRSFGPQRSIRSHSSSLSGYARVNSGTKLRKSIQAKVKSANHRIKSLFGS